MTENTPSTDTPEPRQVPDWIPAFPVLAPDSVDLPPHHDHCLGCGPANPHGHRLRARRDAHGVYAHHRFDSRHVGAPAIAHGGAVATVLDELFGLLLYTVGEPAVTRHLAIDYLAPILLDTPYTLRAHIHSRDGRKLHLKATIENDRAHVVTTATALFLIVDVNHFLTPQHTPTHR
ncbi:PaaI family thioesterase [Nocardia farcinica]|uniref:Acyl-coenzyme A thioesterase THEM4 n=3 Tax=Nocardia TaxID=1817 RepID=Q5YM71_NOCFA|nr:MULTISPECIES: PaaI family thioesterase [Nocardia]MBF6072898.1 PaaI family thioesterase [Nocardia farcinica]MBF6189262.1 PaaI family thioesterase [Nocardia farcinica]MBF6235063.1 PaaI family thioesterase [Nocardia farcinica]MBF6246375.1 PaaI family thioesterase [Nocardia elegans]MBF6314917.1 PaaI family thioesterase [Nocardia farcinica]